MKRCSRCGQVKDETDFYTRKRRDGARVPVSHCKECDHANYRKWRDANREHRDRYDHEYHRRPENQARRALNRKRRNAESPRGVLVITLGHGLKRAPANDPATIDDLMRIFAEQGGKCALSGIEMTWNRGRVLPTSISIDRIDQRRGYEKDNVRLICHAINAFRGRMSDAEMLEMAMTLVAYMTGHITRLGVIG